MYEHSFVVLLVCTAAAVRHVVVLVLVHPAAVHV
jgi:hypothetical protein